MIKIINKSINEGRIDKFLVSELKISRNKVLSLIKDLSVQINGEWVQKPGLLSFLDDAVSIYNVETINVMKPIKMELDIVCSPLFTWWYISLCSSAIVWV